MINSSTTSSDTASSNASFGTVQTVGGWFGYLWQQYADEPAILASGWTKDQQVLRALIHPDLRPAEVDAGNSASIDAAISDWADGDLGALTGVTVRQRSGPFLEGAWEMLRTVRGTTSYRDLAALAGNPGAARAAASACARNAAALFVPCHRVLRTDGRLGGFRYGVAIKRTLIEHERSAQE